MMWLTSLDIWFGYFIKIGGLDLKNLAFYNNNKYFVVFLVLLITDKPAHWVDGD